MKRAQQHNTSHVAGAQTNDEGGIDNSTIPSQYTFTKCRAHCPCCPSHCPDAHHTLTSPARSGEHTCKDPHTTTRTEMQNAAVLVWSHRVSHITTQPTQRRRHAQHVELLPSSELSAQGTHSCAWLVCGNVASLSQGRAKKRWRVLINGMAKQPQTVRAKVGKRAANSACRD